MALASLILTLTLLGFKSFFFADGGDPGRSDLTSALNTAIYWAIEDNQSVKVEAQAAGLVLKVKRASQWITVQEFGLIRQARLKMTPPPYFPQSEESRPQRRSN